MPPKGKSPYSVGFNWWNVNVHLSDARFADFERLPTASHASTVRYAGHLKNINILSDQQVNYYYICPQPLRSKYVRLVFILYQVDYNHNPIPPRPTARPKTSSFRLSRASNRPAPEPDPVALELELDPVAVPVCEPLDAEFGVVVAVLAEPDAVDEGATVLVKATLVSSELPFRTRSQLAASGSPNLESSANCLMSNGNLLERSGTSEKKSAYAAGITKSSGWAYKRNVYLCGPLPSGGVGVR